MYNILLNILIGVVSGIFSSIMVSVCFFIITDNDTQFKESKEMVEPLYTLYMFSNFDELQKFPASKKILPECLEKINHNFAQYEPKRYTGKLNIIMIDIYEFIIDGITHSAVKNEDYSKIKDKTYELINAFNDYQVHYRKYCFFNILNNSVVKLNLVILIILIAVTLIA